MTNEKVYAMSFAKVFPLLINKAVRKGRTEQEVFTVTSWLTGYSNQQIKEALDNDVSYGDFFLNAPCLNPNRVKITGKICGVDLAEIEEPLMQDIRYLDKLVDELAKGKKLEKILRE